MTEPPDWTPNSTPHWLPDWREGHPALRYAVCRACAHPSYLHAGPCSRCGTPDPLLRQAAGTGTVAAITRVERAPTPEWRPFLPYCLALVDLPEGVRVMAHAAPGLSVGDPVQASFRTVAGRLLPFFEPPAGTAAHDAATHADPILS